MTFRMAGKSKTDVPKFNRYSESNNFVGSSRPTL